MKALTKVKIKFCFKIFIAAAIFYLTCQTMASNVVGWRAEQTIDTLRNKHPTTYKDFAGMKVDGKLFVKCLKKQKTVHADNTKLCISQSVFKT